MSRNALNLNFNKLQYEDFTSCIFTFIYRIKLGLIPDQIIKASGPLSNASPPVGTPLRSRWPGTSATMDDVL